MKDDDSMRQRTHTDAKPGAKHRDVDLFSTNEDYESEFWLQGTSSTLSSRQLL